LVERVSGGGNLALTMTNVEFSDKASIQVLFLGTAGETLTILNSGGGILQSKCEAPYGGAVVVNNTNNLTLTGVGAGSRIIIFDTSNNEIGGTSNHTGGDFVFSTLETAINFFVIKLDSRPIRRTNVSLSASTLIPLTQFPDTVFDNPA